MATLFQAINQLDREKLMGLNEEGDLQNSKKEKEKRKKRREEKNKLKNKNDEADMPESEEVGDEMNTVSEEAKDLGEK